MTMTISQEYAKQFSGFVRTQIENSVIRHSFESLADCCPGSQIVKEYLPGIGVVNASSTYPKPNHHTDECICDGVPWRDQW